jgi:hypothetical protein
MLFHFLLLAENDYNCQSRYVSDYKCIKNTLKKPHKLPSTQPFSIFQELSKKLSIPFHGR